MPPGAPLYVLLAVGPHSVHYCENIVPGVRAVAFRNTTLRHHTSQACHWTCWVVVGAEVITGAATVSIHYFTSSPVLPSRVCRIWFSSANRQGRQSVLKGIGVGGKLVRIGAVGVYVVQNVVDTVLNSAEKRSRQIGQPGRP